METEFDKKFATVVFDRRKQVAKKGIGVVEIRVILSRGQMKYFVYGRCKPSELEEVKDSFELRDLLSSYNRTVYRMIHDGEELTVDNFLINIGMRKLIANRSNRPAVYKKRFNFLEYFENYLETARGLSYNNRKVSATVLKALKEFGGIKYGSDLSVDNIKKFDKFLRRPFEDKRPSEKRAKYIQKFIDKGWDLPKLPKLAPARMIVREASSVYTYHKKLRPMIQRAIDDGHMKYNPYDDIKFNPGKSKERNPLTEEQLIAVRNAELPETLARVRDLFIFASYTGLSYCDVMNFNYEKDTETIGGNVYIDGERIKTGSKFFTPILPPAMEVLKRYNFWLPRITNQKANYYLHKIEAIVGLHKPLTFHIARHTFATLLLTHDLPIQNVQRALGHHHVRVTEIYAKNLKKNITRHVDTLVSELL